MNVKRSEFVLGALSAVLLGCTKVDAVGDTENTKEKIGMKKPLVVYFSATGTTKGKAEILAKVLGADLKEIVPAERYTAADLDWHDKKSRSSVEMADKSSRPAMTTKIANMADYDTVFVGFPIWWYVAPTIVNTFLEAHDLAGKRIVSFFTSGGSGEGKTLDYLKPSAPKATFETPKNLTHADESAIRTWVQRRLKPSTSASNSFPTFAVDIATNLLLYSAPSLPRR